MPKLREVRAVHDRESIVVYQAYSAGIAEAALRAGRFVAPFSFGRMTWIKPSFLWLMHRSNWGHKAGQERILAVRVHRAAWDRALSLGVLTSPEAGVFRSPEEWAHAFSDAKVHVQWDPERSLRGAALPYYAIQVGVSRHLVREYAEEWILGSRTSLRSSARSTSKSRQDTRTRRRGSSRTKRCIQWTRQPHAGCGWIPDPDVRPNGRHIAQERSPPRAVSGATLASARNPAKGSATARTRPGR